MDNINLSIIIPHYNDVTLLEKLLDSIPKKDDIEVIIVDDKSNKELIKYEQLKNKYNLSNFYFLNNTRNKKGAGVCRNIGLKNASGKWILFADSDDFFVDGFYKKIRKYFNSNYEVVFFPPTSIYIDSGELAGRHKNFMKILDDYSKNHNLENELAIRYKIPNPISKLIRQNFIKQNDLSFDEVIASNDVMFSTKLGYYMDNFKVDKETIYCITRNKGSLTVNKSKKIFNSRLKVYINYCNFLTKNLKKNYLDFFDFTGQGYLFSAIKYGYGLKKIIDIYQKFKKNNIKAFNYNIMNPIYLIKKLIKHYKLEKELKKYR